MRMLLPALAVVLVAALDLTVVAPILPRVIDDLDINTVDADRYTWIVLAYLIAYTVTVPITGRVSDFVGRVPTFLVALSLFLIGSTITALSSSLAEMIAGRTLQGLGGGAMLPVSMALVADAIPQTRRAAALGIVAAVDTFGWVLGPVWGALIFGATDSWRMIFWLNLPIGFLAALALLKSTPRTIRRDRARLPDLLSTALFIAGLTLFCVALSSGGEAGVGSPSGEVLGGSEHPLAAYRWPVLGFGLVLLMAFVARERVARAPTLPRELLRRRGFQLAIIANGLVGTALVIAMVNAPLFVTLVVDPGDQAVMSAIILAAFALAMSIGAIVGGRMHRSFGARIPAVAGLLVASMGFLSMTLWGDQINYGLMLPTSAVAGLGLGIVIAPIADAAISLATLRDYGLASGLVLLARLLGMSIGLAAITRYAVDQLRSRIGALPAIEPRDGETTAEFFERQENYIIDEAVPVTLDIVSQTFVIAALICVLAIVPAWRLAQRGE